MARRSISALAVVYDAQRHSRKKFRVFRLSAVLNYPVLEAWLDDRFDTTTMTIPKLIGMGVLYLFLPFTALTYCFSRRRRRRAEVKRIIKILKIDIDSDSDYRNAYEAENLVCYFWAVAYASFVTFVGLTLLFLATEIKLPEGEFLHVKLGGVDFPHEGSRLVFGMAFLGAYVWGLQHVFRRYSSNDLTSSVYYGFSMRMIFAAIIALVIYNAYTALAGSGDSKSSGDSKGEGGITANIWPAMAFLIGMFPQRGLRWLTEKFPILSPESDPSVRKAPLEMIEGIEIHDIMRLEEVGIDTCYDLATADFVPLVLKTPYSARQLIDWILQAKLCSYFGEAVKDLRLHGIRTVTDLNTLDEGGTKIDELAKTTTVTKLALECAFRSVKKEEKESNEIERLRKAGQVLGRFWEDKSVPK